MNIRQSILKFIYQILAKSGGKKKININANLNGSKIKPLVSFYSLSAIANNGSRIDFNEFRDMKVLIVNTASACGYTPQYEDLQRLQEQYRDKLTIIGFPCNDFGRQEQGSDETIASFCKINYGVTFLLSRKIHVIKKEEQHEVFKWMSNKHKNGWNDQEPQWNFCKYLIDEKGILLGYFASGIQPFDKEIIDALN